MQSLSALDRDPHARRVLMMDTLDTLEGLRLLKFDTMTKLPVARQALAELETFLPSDVAAVLLPRARQAVDALERLQHGFFLRTEGAGLRLPDKRSGERVVSLADATALWLRVLRNAGHSFDRASKTRDRDEALLLAHGGSLPHELPDLAWLYLLRLLARPERLRGRS